MRVVNVFARRFRRYVFRVPNPNPRGVPIGFQVGNHQALVTQHAFISRYAVSAVVSLTVPIAFASHGSWQVLTAFPFLLPQASDKSQPRPFPAVLMPFAGAWILRWLGGPQWSLGLYSCHSEKCSKSGVSKPKRGYRRGCKFTFDFAKPNIYEGFKLSLERFHTIRD
jgi:hypothetical protein